MNATIDISILTVPQRVELMCRLWESLVKENVPLVLSAHEEEELDRRLDTIEQGTAELVSWDAVYSKMVRSNR